MMRNSTLGNTFGRTLLGGALLLAGPLSAQVLFNEQFTGGASTTGFTVQNLGGDCEWIYAPGGLTPNAFNRDSGGTLPSGAGFDSDFAFIDSDECGGGSTDVTVNTVLVSAPFNASAAGAYILRFDHQFRARLQSFARVEAFNGTTWTAVNTWTTTDVGFPNPAVSTLLDITSAVAGATNAQVRFQFSAGYDWWWAVDNITVTRSTCAFPANLAVGAITQTSGTLSWDDNGSSAYAWAVTTGAYPDGTNEVAAGTGASTVANGLLPGTVYTAFVRSECGDGSNSGYSQGVPFITVIANDECAGATHLTVNPDNACGTVTHGTVNGATDSDIVNECAGAADDDVWFSFVATNDRHNVSLINVNGNVTDMYHAVWTGSCGALTLVPNSCNDADQGIVSGLTVGTTYYVQVYTYATAGDPNTQFDVCIGTPPPPPANDECSGAIALTVNGDDECGTVTPGTVESATDSGVQTECFGTADDDVWFSFVATATTHHISLLNVEGSTGDMYMALWAGNCGALTLVPNSCSDPQDEFVSDLTVGTTYYLQVYTWTDEPDQTSTFDVCIGSGPFESVAEVRGAQALTVAPNPASTQLFLTTTNSSAVTVRVYDVAGHLVMDRALVKQLDIAHLDAGTYTLVALDAKGGAVARTRFVKQ